MISVGIFVVAILIEQVSIVGNCVGGEVTVEFNVKEGQQLGCLLDAPIQLAQCVAQDR